MSDTLTVHTVSALLYTGKGHVAGLIATTTADDMAIILYDALNNTNPATKIFKMAFNSTTPIQIFFTDRYAPRFHTGLYLEMTDPTQVTIWCHQVAIP
jgi:hypothetical protein